MATPTEPSTTYFQAASSPVPAAAVGDEERGRDRRRLDRDPEDAEVVGEDGETHGREEEAHER